jgi:hypothetical protein
VTSQPYTPESASRTEPSAGSSVASDTESEYDPDLVVLDDDDVEEVDVEELAGADEFVSADEGDLGDETDEPLTAVAATTGGITPPEDPSPTDPTPTELTPTELTPTELTPTELTPTEPVLSEQWHDIQAMFVDDPQGSVQRAAAAADDAVSALVESLRQRQAVLGPADPADTEQLRSTLRSYRIFCQRVAVLDEQLPRVGAIDR